MTYNRVDILAAGETLTLLYDDVSDGYAVEDIQGLDPVKATMSSSSYASLRGSKFQSSKTPERNIIFVIGYEPDWVTNSVQSLRANLYRFFMPELDIVMRFYLNDTDYVSIEGRVEDFDSPLFAKDPTATISVLCFDPDFVSPDEITVVGSTVEDSTETLIEYDNDGAVSVGFRFTLNVDRTLTDFTIHVRYDDGTDTTLNFSASLVADDVVTIKTIPGEKEATLVRSAVVSSVLYGVLPQSVYPMLKPGNNYLRVQAAGAAIPYTLVYKPRLGAL